MHRQIPENNHTATGKILKGTGLAMLGAGLAYLLAMLDVIDVGAYGPVAAALLSAALNTVQVEMKRRNYNALESA